MAEPGKKFTILAFVGGGIRGLMSVTILKKLLDALPASHAGQHRPDRRLLDRDRSSRASSWRERRPSDLITFFTKNKKGEIGFYDNMNTDPHTPAYHIQNVYGSQFALHADKKVSALDAQGVCSCPSMSADSKRCRTASRRPRRGSRSWYTNMIPGLGDVTIAKAATSSGAMPATTGLLPGQRRRRLLQPRPDGRGHLACRERGACKLEDITAITIGTGIHARLDRQRHHRLGRQPVDERRWPIRSTTRRRSS
jgi:hypothetical protein